MNALLLHIIPNLIMLSHKHLNQINSRKTKLSNIFAIFKHLYKIIYEKSTLLKSIQPRLSFLQWWNMLGHLQIPLNYTNLEENILARFQH